MKVKIDIKNNMKFEKHRLIDNKNYEDELADDYNIPLNVVKFDSNIIL